MTRRNVIREVGSEPVTTVNATRGGASLKDKTDGGAENQPKEPRRRMLYICTTSMTTKDMGKYNLHSVFRDRVVVWSCEGCLAEAVA